LLQPYGNQPPPHVMPYLEKRRVNREKIILKKQKEKKEEKETTMDYSYRRPPQTSP